MTGFPTDGPRPIPASAVPSAKRSREETLRAFLAGERVRDNHGRAWPRAETMLDAARRELAEIEAQEQRLRALEEQRRAIPDLGPCPWCGGDRVMNVPAGRPICMKCNHLGGVQESRIANSGPQPIVFFLAPR